MYIYIELESKSRKSFNTLCKKVSYKKIIHISFFGAQVKISIILKDNERTK